MKYEFASEYFCAICKVWFESEEPSAVCGSACRHLSWGMDPDELPVLKRTAQRYDRPKPPPGTKKKGAVRAYRRVVEIARHEVQYQCAWCGNWFPATKLAVYCSNSHRVMAHQAIAAGKRPPYEASPQRVYPPGTKKRPLG